MNLPMNILIVILPCLSFLSLVMAKKSARKGKRESESVACGDEPRRSPCRDTESIRFNKIPVIEGISPPGHLPMTSDNYPLSDDDAEWLRLTGAISVFRYEDCFRMECDMTPQQLVEAAKVPIYHPSLDPHNPFWNDLEAVVDAQISRLGNESPTSVLPEPLPNIWSTYDIHQVAEAVHTDFPGAIHMELIKEMFGGGLDRPYNPNCDGCALVDRSIIPSASMTEFIRGVVMLSDINTWAFGAIGPLSFSVKWYVGRARPEEMVWEIYNERLTEDDGVPEDLVSKIQNDLPTLRSMQSFTAYPEGSPDHPSWPAMHSAASAASLWMAVVLDLTTEQWCEIKSVDYGISFGRTVAGVHYPSDNIAGLNIGQEIMAQKLPAYLAMRYGSNPAAVAEKVQGVRFDWNDYLDSECFEKSIHFSAESECVDNPSELDYIGCRDAQSFA